MGAYRVSIDTVLQSTHHCQGYSAVRELGSHKRSMPQPRGYPTDWAASSVDVRACADLAQSTTPCIRRIQAQAQMHRLASAEGGVRSPTEKVLRLSQTDLDLTAAAAFTGLKRIRMLL